MVGTWMLIMTNVVPISLLVSLEVIKLWQGSFMGWDVLMYDLNQDLPMTPRCTSINEELGQVEYIFSDKTGTLTCNIMHFRKFSAGQYSYDNLDMVPDDEKESDLEHPFFGSEKSPVSPAREMNEPRPEYESLFMKN